MLYHMRKNDKNEKENTKTGKRCWYRSDSDMNVIREHSGSGNDSEKKALGGAKIL